MKSKKNVYATPDIEVMEMEMEGAVLIDASGNSSNDSDTEEMQDARGGTDWSQYYNYNN